MRLKVFQSTVDVLWDIKLVIWPKNLYFKKKKKVFTKALSFIIIIIIIC